MVFTMTEATVRIPMKITVTMPPKGQVPKLVTIRHKSMWTIAECPS